MNPRLIFLIPVATMLLCYTTYAQDELYKNTFPLGEVELLEGPFKYARDLNIRTLLQYDVDRLMAPYRKESGLGAKASSYPNWDGLDGHVGGHYLSALAMNYAATENPECKKRILYMISELQACQEANAANHPDWGTGYAGGVPNSKAIWSTLKNGDFSAYRSAWVPWYNVHKIFAGLRDAWLYTGNDDARIIFLKFCDWAINVTSGLTDLQMQTMLDMEHGGMNEIFADAWQMTGDRKYMVAAKHFSHNMLLDAMSAHEDNLDNKHANTQVPKAIGFQRIAELTGDEKFLRAGSFFWETVTSNRSLAFGGNSRREFFPAVTACTDFVNDVEGPESCNSYNMLKLSEDLFRVNPSAKYIDYYERTLYNHILATQHPDHGGYVYFTPARPRHYKVYSAPNQAMWCCVGSGMENHGKYNQLIYTHQNDSLYLNLYIASQLNWREKGIKIRQETNFPDEEKTKLRVLEGSAKFTLMIRHPLWVKAGAMNILVNGKKVKYTVLLSSYVAIDRHWKKEDIVEIMLPMHNRIEYLPNVPNYIAVMRGPILLGAKTGSENLDGLIADDSRWAHMAHGQRLPVDKAPIIVIDDKSKITDLIPIRGKPLNYTFKDLKIVNPINVVLEPFFRIHDSRYMMYWMALSGSQYRSYLDSLSAVEKQKITLQQRTIDFVAPGEQQPEADHKLEQLNSRTGNHLNEFWRDAINEGHFSYNLSTNGETGLSLMVRYWGAEWGNRNFEIYINEEKLVSENNTGRWNQSKFFDIEYPIPDAMLNDKKNITVKFKALPQSTAGAVYYVRLVRRKQ
jgi:uncharacterized protein